MKRKEARQEARRSNMRFAAELVLLTLNKLIA